MDQLDSHSWLQLDPTHQESMGDDAHTQETHLRFWHNTHPRWWIWLDKLDSQLAIPNRWYVVDYTHTQETRL